jgi:uncharacterized protein involved in exopolysaccharide biosynthesis
MTQSEIDSGSSPGRSLIEFLSLLANYRKLISRSVVGTTLVVTIVALLLPKWYKSTASVFPAEKSDLLGALDGVSSIAKAFSPARALSSLTGNPESDRYLAILKSNTVLNAVIDKFDLVNVYEITSYPREKSMKELLNNVEFEAELEGNITIDVYDKDPQRAADMANYFVEMLNKTNSEIQVQNARGNRMFIEERYRKNLADLAAAEDSLKEFQEKYGVIALPEQTEASIKAAAEISAQLALKEVQEGVFKRTLSADHPSVEGARIEVQELRRKLTEMNRGSGSSNSNMNILVPFTKLPEWGREYIRRYREVEIQYKILQFITPLYEQAKVEEKRQTPSVLILDTAVPAERKSKPKVTLYALIALVSSLLLSIFAVLILESIRKLRTSHPERFDNMVKTLRGDWLGLRFQKK